MKNAVRCAAASLAAGLLAAGTAAADGRILTTGADIATGSAPHAGVVAIDASAAPQPLPDVPAPAAPPERGALDTSLPDRVVGVGGAAFLADHDVTLLAGTYDYSSYTVLPGVKVLYSGVATIRTTGDVLIEGYVGVADLAPKIEFDCGGDFRVIAHAANAVSGIESRGSGRLVIDAAKSLTVSSADGSRATIRSDVGTELRARGAGVAVSLTDAELDGYGISIKSASGLQFTRTSVEPLYYSIDVAALGGDAAFTDSELQAWIVGGVHVAASGAVVVDGTSMLATHDVSVDAYGGSVSLRGGSLLESKQGTDRRVRVAAATDVDVSGASIVRHDYVGPIEIYAYGGDVAIGAAGDAATIDQRSSGSVVIAASGSAAVGGSATIDTVDGDATIAAVSGAASLAGTARLAARNGDVSIRAGGAASVASSASVSGKSASFSGASVDLESTSVATTVGGVTVVTEGDASASGSIAAAREVAIASRSGNVTLAGATISTASGGVSSGWVDVSSYAGDAATIDVRGATIRTGDASDASGDVALAVRTRSVDSTTPAPTDLLVMTVGIVENRRDSSRSLAAGQFFVYLGPTLTLADLAGPATITVGGVATNVALTLNRRGNLVGAAAGARCLVTPAFRGSRFASCVFALRGDFGPALAAAAAGPIDVSFTAGPLDAVGRVDPLKNRFSLRNRRGALVAPTLVDVQRKSAADGVNEKWLDKLVRRSGR